MTPERQSASLTRRRDVIITSGAFGLIGIVVATLGVVNGMSAARPDGVAPGAAGAAFLCSTWPDASEPPFYRELKAANARMHKSMEIVPSGDADRDFARMMIPHHRGAIEMAVVQLKYGRDERLKRLAQSMVVEQEQEIAYMRTLIDAPPLETSVTGRSTDR